MPTAIVNGEAGEDVVPPGNPESVTDTEPVNPFTLPIAVLKVAVDDPVFAVIVVGDKAMLKSLLGTVNARAAECASAPDVPFTSTL